MTVIPKSAPVNVCDSFLLSFLNRSNCLVTLNILATSEIIFIDLTRPEVVEKELHTGPTATAEELARISQQFLKKCRAEDDDKRLNYSNVTIRKRNRWCTNSSEESDSLTTNSIHIQDESDAVQNNPVQPKSLARKTFLESLNGKTL